MTMHTTTAQDAQRIQLLRAALGDLDTWQTWTMQVDLVHDELSDDTFHLLPHIYQQIEAQGAEVPHLQRLKGIYKYAWVQNQRALQCLTTLVAVLRERQIEPMVVGNAAFALRDEWFRPILALNLVVPHRQLTTAYATLQNADWQPETSLNAKTPFLSTPIKFHAPQKPAVIIDWRSLSACNSSGSWRGEKIAFAGNTVYVADQNAQTLLSASQANLSSAPGLLSLIDFARLWRETDVRRVKEMADAHWLTQDLTYALALLAQVEQRTLQMPHSRSPFSMLQRSTLLSRIHNEIHLPQPFSRLRPLSRRLRKQAKRAFFVRHLRRLLRGKT